MTMEYLAARATIDNISMRRFGRCPSYDKLSRWRLQKMWVASWDENREEEWEEEIKYFDMKMKEISYEEALELPFYKKEIAIKRKVT